MMKPKKLNSGTTTTPESKYFSMYCTEQIEPWFQDYHTPEDFEKAGCLYCEPMLAQEVDEETQNALFDSDECFIEEKFDGTRGILQFFDNDKLHLPNVPQRGFTRCFSRRISKKTGWFCENTDSLPQLRNIDIPELAGTVIDGEMFIPGKLFKVVSSTLNCLWDEAINRQCTVGGIVFHAFDILKYKGIDCEKMPLNRRKYYLHKVIERTNRAIEKSYICEVPYFDDENPPCVYMPHPEIRKLQVNMSAAFSAFPTLCKDIGLESDTNAFRGNLSKRGYYEYIVFRGGEGVILKPKNGRYYHKRGKEYMKVKKFLTREVIITDFLPPTKEYGGKFPNDTWLYWVDENGQKVDIPFAEKNGAKNMQAKGCIPVTKYYFFNQIGTIEYGVILNDEAAKTIKKLPELTVKEINDMPILVVGECGGFDEEERRRMTDNTADLIGQVIEVKANEIFKDTGKLRHPRFMRHRPDKNAEECTWQSHIGE